MGCGSGHLPNISTFALPTNQVDSSKIPVKMDSSDDDSIVSNSTGDESEDDSIVSNTKGGPATTVVGKVVGPSSQLSPQVKAELMVKGSKKFGTATMELDELYVELGRRCSELMAMKDFSSVECMDHLGFIREVSINLQLSRVKKVAIAVYLHSKGIAEIFLNVWKFSFPLDFLNPKNQRILAIMKFVTVTLLNLTDRSSDLCERVVKLRVYQHIFRYLRDEKINPKHLDDARQLYLVRRLLGILHNTVHYCPAAREAYRDCSAVSILRTIRASSNAMVDLKAGILLAYIINEDENEVINADSKSFTLIVIILESALKSPNHRSEEYGFRTVQLITGLNKLAANDANKTRIVESGALPFYVRLLAPECSKDEQKAAAQGIWILYFKCSDAIKKEPGCLEGLWVLFNLCFLIH